MATKGLVYAEVGQLPNQNQRNKQTSFFDLDDTPIEYARLNHGLLVDKNSTAHKIQPLDDTPTEYAWLNNDLPMDKNSIAHTVQPVEENKSLGVCTILWDLA